MINNPRNQRVGFAICHMVQQFYPEDVITRTGSTVKLKTFSAVINKVQQVIFGIEK
jgi:hypothetical protein